MELEQGKIITGTFIIDKITVNGKVAEIELIDGTTKILGLLKDNIDLFTKTYVVGEKIICKGRVRKRRKSNCLDLVYISKDMLELNAVSDKFDVEKFIKRFDELIASVSDIEYKKILTNCFNEDVRDMFFTHPAAKDNHHNYTHGLLQHTIEVVDLSLLIANYFKNVNKDLLICAGILHDIGKLKSYDVDDDFTKVVKTDWEGLLGHLPISALFVSKITPQEIDQEKIMLLYHAILSHHGQYSPIIYKTKEAFILHQADMLSSTVNHIDSITYTNKWSEKINNHTWFRSEDARV